MKIVIEIPDQKYKWIVDNPQIYTDDLCEAIRNGTPLPEHHGRLIDADAIEYTHAIARSLDDGHNWNELCVTKDELYNAPTIIEGSDTE